MVTQLYESGFAIVMAAFLYLYQFSDRMICMYGK